MKAIFTDEEIMTKLRSKDSATINMAMRHLYKEYHGLIYNLVSKNSGNEEDAKDVFQEGLISFYNQVIHKDLKLTCTIKTYLYSVCRNLWLAKLRKLSKEDALTDTESFVSLEKDELQTMINSERSTIISKVIGQLDEDCQKILLYFYYQKKSIKEITASLSSPSDQATKTKKSRCMDRLRNMVKSNPSLSNLLRS